jgi:ubiquinone biosynthesis accessory factor UbiK
MDTPRIDEIARRLFESVPPAARAIQKDLESNFRAVLRASLTKLDLVSRDEFDAQMRVLERTRARLEELERRVAGMEGGGGGAAGAGPAVGTAAGGATGAGPGGGAATASSAPPGDRASAAGP